MKNHKHLQEELNHALITHVPQMLTEATSLVQQRFDPAITQEKFDAASEIRAAYLCPHCNAEAYDDRKFYRISDHKCYACGMPAKEKVAIHPVGASSLIVQPIKDGFIAMEYRAAVYQFYHDTFIPEVKLGAEPYRVYYCKKDVGIAFANVHSHVFEKEPTVFGYALRNNPHHKKVYEKMLSIKTVDTLDEADWSELKDIVRI